MLIVVALDLDQEALRKRNDELSQAFKEKNKKLLQTQELYDKLKRRAMIGQMQDAAEDAVDSSLHVGNTLEGIDPATDNGEATYGLYQNPRGSFRSSEEPGRSLHHVDETRSDQMRGRGQIGVWPNVVGAAGESKSGYCREIIEYHRRRTSTLR